MNKTTSFVLDEPTGLYIQEKIEAGQYKNASEIMRVALRRMMEDEYRLTPEEIQEIDSDFEAIDNGTAKTLSRQEYRQEFKKLAGGI